MKIYSKIVTNKLILSVLKFNEISEKRQDISPDDEFLQVSAVKLKKNFHVKSHKHKKLKRESDITQETWIILKGKIFGKFYDLDNKFLYEDTFTSGDCVTIYRGGHEFIVLDDNTYFFEIKNGPYYGNEKDREK